RRGGRHRRRRPDALHPRGDEADERGQVRPRGGGAQDPRRQCATCRVRAAAVRPRAAHRPAPRRDLMFSRVLVANRGEIAVRVIRALHELGIEAIAVYSTADADALHVPGSEGTATLEEAKVAAEELGYPVLLKAAAGGGGRGMRLVGGPAEIEDAYARASHEAQAAFADGALYVEKAISPARHVEIQVICDNHDGVLTCGERECSIQRRHQKLLEESPSPALDADLREAMESAAERASRHIGYRNAGTFEFLVGPDGAFSFIELNARLQVEHPVTELVTGLDLGRMQVRVAAGESLPLTGRAPRSGRAIEIRIN